MGGFVAVHDWHLAIHGDEAIAGKGTFFERDAAVIGKFDGTAEALKHRAGDFSVDEVIVDDENREKVGGDGGEIDGRGGGIDGKESSQSGGSDGPGDGSGIKTADAFGNQA